MSDQHGGRRCALRDWRTRAGFEECFGWFLSNDDKGAMPFDDVDRALCRYREYRGYCSVYSGGKSIHSHFLFDTRHLINARMGWNKHKG
jgi:hypothetical protein